VETPGGSCFHLHEMFLQNFDNNYPTTRCIIYRTSTKI